MAIKQRSRIDTAPAAVVVRLVAFLAAAVGVIALPATIVAVSTGILSHHAALIAAGSALGLIVTAALAVRPFDPLRN